MSDTRNANSVEFDNLVEPIVTEDGVIGADGILRGPDGLPKPKFKVSAEELAMYNFEEVEIDAHLPTPSPEMNREMERQIYV